MLKSHFKEDKTIKQGFSAKKCLEKISGEMRVAYGSWCHQINSFSSSRGILGTSWMVVASFLPAYHCKEKCVVSELYLDAHII